MHFLSCLYFQNDVFWFLLMLKQVYLLPLKLCKVPKHYKYKKIAFFQEFCLNSTGNFNGDYTNQAEFVR